MFASRFIQKLDSRKYKKRRLMITWYRERSKCDYVLSIMVWNSHTTPIIYISKSFHSEIRQQKYKKRRLIVTWHRERSRCDYVLSIMVSYSHTTLIIYVSKSFHSEIWQQKIQKEETYYHLTSREIKIWLCSKYYGLL